MKAIQKSKKANIPVILVLIVLIPSFLSSQAFTDPFIIPKYFWLYFFSIGAFLVFAIWNFSRKYITTYTLNHLDIAVLAWFGYTLLRALLTPEMSLSNSNLLVLFIGILIYYLYKPFFTVSEGNERTHELFISIISFICLGQVLYGILQYLDLLPRLQTEFKLGGAFGNPGTYSNFLVAVIPFSLVQLLYSKKQSLNYYLAIIALIASLIVLPLTKARAAWIAVLASSAYILFYRFELGTYLRKIFKTLISRAIALTVVVALIAGSAIFLYKFKEGSSSGRLFIWKVSAQMIPEKPLFGYGYDRYAVSHNSHQAEYFATGEYTQAEAELADNVSYAFNEYLQITIETGIIGLLLFLLILVLAFINPFYKTKEKVILKPIQLAALSGMIAILITSLFSYPLRNVPTNVFFFLLLAIVGANKIHWKEFKLNQQTRRTLSFAGCIILLVFFLNQLGKYKASQEWYDAFKMVRANDYNRAKETYANLYPALKNQPYFLFNYGAELSLMGDYTKSIELLKEVEPQLNDADLYIYLGNSYIGLDDYPNAIICFKQSSNLMPVKFYPKYRLTKIYIQKGEISKAKALAKEILSKRVKIPSSIINDIRNEMQLFIDNN